MATDLAPDIYTICIAVTGEDYEQCIFVKVIEGSIVSGKSSVTEGKASVEIEKGTAPFVVYVNDKEALTISSSRFSVDVKHGDKL